MRAHDGAVHDGGAVGDDDAVLERAGVDETEAADGHVVTDRGPEHRVRDVHGRTLREEPVAPDAHPFAVGAQGREPAQLEARSGHRASDDGRCRRQLHRRRKIGNEFVIGTHASYGILRTPAFRGRCPMPTSGARRCRPSTPRRKRARSSQASGSATRRSPSQQACRAARSLSRCRAHAARGSGGRSAASPSTGRADATRSRVSRRDRRTC